MLVHQIWDYDGSGVGLPRCVPPLIGAERARDRAVPVVIVGAGFAGIACAKELAKHDIRVVVIDRNNYHQFQPLLYQVATAQLGVGDIARSLRGIFAKDHSVSVKTAAVVSADPGTHTVTTGDGTRYSGEVLVLAPGAQPNFFRTPVPPSTPSRSTRW